MRTVYRLHWHTSLYLCLSSIALLLALTACGANSTAGSNTGAAPTTGPTSTPTQVATTTSSTTNTTTGCPNTATPTTLPAQATMTVDPSKVDQTLTAHTGDVIEVQAPFGFKWTGPIASQGGLELQQPSGYALSSAKVCVWRFIAKSAGSTQLEFNSQAICKPNQMCALFIRNTPITVDVK